MEKGRVRFKHVFSIAWNFILWLIFVVTLWTMGCFDFLGPIQQKSSSQFVRVSDVTIDNYKYTTSSRGNVSAGLTVNLTYHGHRYKHLIVASGDPGLVPDRPTFCFINYSDAAVWHARGITPDTYIDDKTNDLVRLPKHPSKLLTYNHEKRISKGTYAIQVNKWTPSVKDQLEDRVVCLVSN